MAATTAEQVRFVGCALELRGDILRRLKIRTRVRVPLWGGDLPREVRSETGVCLSETGVCLSETGVCLSETSVCLSETGVSL
eukprot:COSAG01_NODE_27091_length_694_cov_26.169748_2_plen_82_part_00